MAYTKQHAHQNKILLEKAMQVVAERNVRGRDRDVFDNEYHSHLQGAVFAAIDELFVATLAWRDISHERKRRIYTKAVSRLSKLMRSR